MRTLYDVCKPRESVLSGRQKDDVLNLSDLLEGRVDPDLFFEENYRTEGMRTLIQTAFNRFIKEDPNGVIKLTQTMGGGKTHNMIALGLLALNPVYRDSILDNSPDYRNLGRVRVVAFSGRESDAPLGIWGAIAKQLGKKDYLKDYYSPLQAPGETAWINLLQGDPLLILLDELPPYLEYAKAKPIGNSDLSVVTTTALSNLFTAAGKAQLANVCVVVSDLRATYEGGSRQLGTALKSLENELSRSALNIEPVGSSSDDVYQILKKRLFDSLPKKDDINDIAIGYKDSVLTAKQMGYTYITPESIYNGIKESYPFHPSIRDLYARFKENQGFQQTRGLIRLMRQVVAQIYSGNAPLSKKKYLINVFDFDLNDNNMHTTITQIKNSLSNAISHDIASQGRSVAEEIDTTYKQTLVQDIAKLILVSSLADVPHALLGLTLSDIIGNLCEPGRDITNVKASLEEFVQKAWYIKQDKEGKIYFQNIKNMNAELQSLVESYDNESVKNTTLKIFLSDIFMPKVKDCYQELLVFPAIDEIRLSPSAVTLILFEPWTGTGLHPDLRSLYDNCAYKNRVMFLSGKKDTMNHLYASAKDLKAIDRIIANMREENIAESDSQYQLAQDLRIKKNTAMLSSARETFTTLYYPNKNDISEADFIMEFVGNRYDGEDQIRKLLLEKHKLIVTAADDTLRKKCEERLFTRKQMTWKDITDRAATNTAWQWHHPDTLFHLRQFAIRNGHWKEEGQYIEKGPFEKEKTDVLITESNTLTDKTILQIRPIYGDKIFYEIGAKATPGSAPVPNLNNFETTEVKLSFLCVDSKGIHPTGEPKEWKKQIIIKHKFRDKPGGKRYLELESHPKVSLKYTTDGSNPKISGGLYSDEFLVPDGSSVILVAAEYDGEYLAQEEIKNSRDEAEKLIINPDKPLTLRKVFRITDTPATFENIKNLKEYAQSVSDINIVIHFTNEQNKKTFVELNLGDGIITTGHGIEKAIDNIRDVFIRTEHNIVELEYRVVAFEKAQNFYDWLNSNNMSLSDINPGEIEQ